MEFLKKKLATTHGYDNGSTATITTTTYGPLASSSSDGNADGNALFFRAKESLKVVRAHVAGLEAAVAAEKRAMATERQVLGKRDYGSSSTSAAVHLALSQLAYDAEEMKARSVVGEDFFELYRQVRRELGEKELEIRERIIRGLDTADLEAKFARAKTLKKTYYKAQAKHDQLVSQVESLTKSSARDVGTKKLSGAQQAEQTAAREAKELEQSALDAILQAHTDADRLVMYQMCEILKIQLDGKRKQVEYLESVFEKVEAALDKISKQEEIEHQMQQQRQARINDIRNELGVPTFENLCSKLGLDEKCLRAVEIRPFENEGVVQRIERTVHIVHGTDTAPGALVLSNYRVAFLPYTNSTFAIPDLANQPTRAFVLYAFKGENDGELACMTNDIVEIIESYDDGWVRAAKVDAQTGELSFEGLIPTSYLDIEGYRQQEISALQQQSPVDMGYFDPTTKITSIPLLAISHVDVEGNIVAIWTEDLKSLVLSVNHSSTEADRLRVMIESFAFSTANAFAYYYRPSYYFMDPKYGWNVYDAHSEYLTRQGLSSSTSWRVSDVNREYMLCSTYPATLAVHKSLSDEDLVQVAKFRSKRRIPVVSWKKPGGVNAILRASQPLRVMGSWQDMASKSLTMDAAMCETLADTSSDSHLTVFDARPQISAVGNVALGGGWENSARYKRVRMSFLGIGNIHVVRSAFVKMHSLITSKVSTLGIQGVENALRNDTDLGGDWLQIVSIILEGSRKIVQAIQEGKTVLVHCSDGWDRTAQLAALAMIIMDPYYRTLTGFQVLIAKEWLSFGHKFAQRLGHRDNESERPNVLANSRGHAVSGSSDFPTVDEEDNQAIEANFFGAKAAAEHAQRRDEKPSPPPPPPPPLPPKARRQFSVGSSSDLLYQQNADRNRSSSAAVFEETTSPSEKKSKKKKRKDKSDRMNYRDKQRSPVFTQFLDCVYQIVAQFPDAFEFTPDLLEYILHQSYACQFGTFLCDCERERFEQSLPERTTSLWSEITANAHLFINPKWLGQYYYVTHLQVNVDRAHLRLWPAYINRWA